MYDPDHAPQFDFGMLCSDSSDTVSGNEADVESDSSSDGDSDVMMSDDGPDDHQDPFHDDSDFSEEANNNLFVSLVLISLRMVLRFEVLTCLLG